MFVSACVHDACFLHTSSRAGSKNNCTPNHEQESNIIFPLNFLKLQHPYRHILFALNASFVPIEGNRVERTREAAAVHARSRPQSDI